MKERVQAPFEGTALTLVTYGVSRSVSGLVGMNLKRDWPATLPPETPQMGTRVYLRSWRGKRDSDADLLRGRVSPIRENGSARTFPQDRAAAALIPATC